MATATRFHSAVLSIADDELMTERARRCYYDCYANCAGRASNSMVLCRRTEAWAHRARFGMRNRCAVPRPTL